MTDTSSAYSTLEARFARIARIEDAAGILNWDTHVMLPEGSFAGRAEQSATLSRIAHDMLVAEDLASLIADAATDPGLDAWQRANLGEMQRAHLHASAIPGDLAEALSVAGSRSEQAWREARRKSDFSILKPHLAHLIDLTRQAASAKGEAMGLAPYDALLDTFDAGLRQARVDRLFDPLRDSLPPLIREAVEAQQRNPAIPLPGPHSEDVQKRVGTEIVTAMGFDFTRGRLDVSLHPFTGGAFGDVRITARYDENDLTKSLMAVMHEGGHALYEQGRPERWRGQPVGAARGMSLHESQSLIWEKQVGRSRPFVEHLAPILRKAFGVSGPAWEADNLHRVLTTVAPGPIRVDADEITYPAHIILRYDLERAMIAGDLALDDLPGAFNEGLARLIGVTPKDDAHGCLQDIHWPSGAFGYFPTYAIGAMIAAQLFRAAVKADPAIVPGIGRGEFTPLRTWLKANVHDKASSLSEDGIVAAATGRPLEPEDYADHLRRRYVLER